MPNHEHERDSAGRCLVCLRYDEKLRLVERYQRARAPILKRLILQQLEKLG